MDDCYKWWAYVRIWDDIDGSDNRPTERAAFRNIRRQAWLLEVERFVNRVSWRLYGK